MLWVSPFCPAQIQRPSRVVRYRNFMMLCATLVDQHVQPGYFSLLTHPTPPGVNNLKVWIEEAWQSGSCIHKIRAGAWIDPFMSGFDPEGAEGLKGELVGHKKWIGTAGIFVPHSRSTQSADHRTYKNCTSHSLTEEFRRPLFGLRRTPESHSYFSGPDSPTSIPPMAVSCNAL